MPLLRVVTFPKNKDPRFLSSHCDAVFGILCPITGFLSRTQAGESWLRSGLTCHINSFLDHLMLVKLEAIRYLVGGHR